MRDTSLPPAPVIVDTVRTPIGRYGGALAAVRPDDLAALVISAIVDRTGVDPNLIDDVILGCTNQAGEDNRNVARMASLIAGLPETVPGQTVNRLCASGLQAIASASQAIRAREGSIFIAGGVESMTRSPYVMLKPGTPYPRGDLGLVDSTLGWRFVNPELAARHHPIRWEKRPRMSPSDAPFHASPRMPSRLKARDAPKSPSLKDASCERSCPFVCLRKTDSPTSPSTSIPDPAPLQQISRGCGQCSERAAA
ncbi:MAG: beta-ketoacyl synthase N-terminal-like domain-containing protein [Thermomicrobiales bacterium]